MSIPRVYMRRYPNNNSTSSNQNNNYIHYSHNGNSSTCHHYSKLEKNGQKHHHHHHSNNRNETNSDTHYSFSSSSHRLLSSPLGHPPKEKRRHRMSYALNPASDYPISGNTTSVDDFGNTSCRPYPSIDTLRLNYIHTDVPVCNPIGHAISSSHCEPTFLTKMPPPPSLSLAPFHPRSSHGGIPFSERQVRRSSPPSLHQNPSTWNQYAKPTIWESPSTSHPKEAQQLSGPCLDDIPNHVVDFHVLPFLDGNTLAKLCCVSKGLRASIVSDCGLWRQAVLCEFGPLSQLGPYLPDDVLLSLRQTENGMTNGISTWKEAYAFLSSNPTASSYLRVLTSSQGHFTHNRTTLSVLPSWGNPTVEERQPCPFVPVKKLNPSRPTLLFIKQMTYYGSDSNYTYSFSLLQSQGVTTQTLRLSDKQQYSPSELKETFVKLARLSIWCVGLPGDHLLSFQKTLAFLSTSPDPLRAQALPSIRVNKRGSVRGSIPCCCLPQCPRAACQLIAFISELTSNPQRDRCASNDLVTQTNLGNIAAACRAPSEPLQSFMFDNSIGCVQIYSLESPHMSSLPRCQIHNGGRSNSAPSLTVPSRIVDLNMNDVREPQRPVNCQDALEIDPRTILHQLQETCFFFSQRARTANLSIDCSMSPDQSVETHFSTSIHLLSFSKLCQALPSTILGLLGIKTLPQEVPRPERPEVNARVKASICDASAFSLVHLTDSRHNDSRNPFPPICKEQGDRPSRRMEQLYLHLEIMRDVKTSETEARDHRFIEERLHSISKSHNNDGSRQCPDVLPCTVYCFPLVRKTRFPQSRTKLTEGVHLTVQSCATGKLLALVSRNGQGRPTSLSSSITRQRNGRRRRSNQTPLDLHIELPVSPDKLSDIRLNATITNSEGRPLVSLLSSSEIKIIQLPNGADMDGSTLISSESHLYTSTPPNLASGQWQSEIGNILALEVAERPSSTDPLQQRAEGPCCHKVLLRHLRLCLNAEQLTAQLTPMDFRLFFTGLTSSVMTSPSDPPYSDQHLPSIQPRTNDISNYEMPMFSSYHFRR